MAAGLLYALNQFLHNLLVVAFVGGALAAVVLIREGNRGGLTLDEKMLFILRKQAHRGFWTLAALMATGVNFGLLSLSLHGKLPDIGPIAWGALTVKVLLAFVCLGLLWHLWKRIGPQIGAVSGRQEAGGLLDPEERARLAALRMREQGLWLSLLVLGSLTIFCAALLRYMS